MLRLYILRHLKTAWARPGQSDFDRELNARGRADLEVVRRCIDRHGYQPKFVYCSPAVRTRATFAGISQSFAETPQSAFPEPMYSGNSQTYLDIVRAHPKPEALMLIGHNPTCSSLAALLAGSGDDGALGRLARKFPTGALAVLDFASNSWMEIGQGDGILKAFWTPKTPLPA